MGRAAFGAQPVRLPVRTAAAPRAGLLHHARGPVLDAAAQAGHRSPGSRRDHRLHGHLFGDRGPIPPCREPPRGPRHRGGRPGHVWACVLGLGPRLPAPVFLDHPRGQAPRYRGPVFAEPPSRLPGRDRGRHRDQPRHSRLAGGAGRPLFHSVRAPPHPLGGGRACARLPERLSRLRPPRGALPSQPVQGTQLIGRLRLTERLSARTLLLGGVMIVTLSLFISSEQDPDFWWHLRTGRWMLDNGRLPSQDLFTFTVPSHVWTDHEYLTEVLMWLLYSAIGAVGLAIVFGLITWAGFWLIARQVRRQPFVIVGIGLALGALAGWPIWGPRAQMITFALSCLELYWIQGYLSGRSRALNFFPLVMALWANLHGGWVIGFVWLGVALVSELAGWVTDRSNPAHKAHVRFLAIVTAASLVAVLATPHGLSLYLYPFQTQGSVAQQKLIVEWFSPDFHQIYLRPFEAMVFIVIAGFALRRPHLYDFFLTMAALGLALQSVRHIALFVAVATPVIINCYSAYWKEVSSARGWKLDLPPRRIFAVVTGAVLVLVIVVALIKIDGDVNPPTQASLDPRSYP